MPHQQTDLMAEFAPFQVPVEGREGGDVAAGGFVFGETFDTLLHHLSEGYLRAAWERLSSILQRYAVVADGLTWGWLHGGVTEVPGMTLPAPSDFTGWTSPRLARFYENSTFEQLDNDLRAASPVLRCACTYRAHYWRIAPDDFTTGLRLIEALWTDDPADWSPSSVLLDQQHLLALNRQFGAAYQRGDQVEADRFWAEESAVRASVSPEYRLTDSQGLNEPWRKIARALHERDQQQLRNALAAAQRAYSPLGYRILLRGYANTLDGATMLPLA